MLASLARRIPRFRFTAALIALLLLAAGCRHSTVFSSDVSTDAKPWTHLQFNNDPENFQFAIVADRTGGARPGIFESAVDKLNLLQPEFVITVGDMIEGYTDDETTLHHQWDEFTGFVHRLQMPFFFLPGNHDDVSPVMRRVYRERFGQTYYSFVYRKVLFLALDSQDADPGLSPEQVTWALNTLRANPNVRWTLVFMHQPLWVYEEGHLHTSRKVINAGQHTGFGDIQAVLASRPHTVFAGHFHQYAKFERQSRNYYILGTTGGQSDLLGPGFGEFDHAVWVTLTTNGPVQANLKLDGILPDDVHTEAHIQLENGLALTATDPFEPALGARMQLPLFNPFSHQMHAEIVWRLPTDGDWSVTPAVTNVDVPSHRTNTVDFTLRYTGTAALPTPPACTVLATAGSAYMPASPLSVAFPLDALFTRYRPTTLATRTASPPVIDGCLDDAAWQRPAQVVDFRRPDGRVPTVDTQASVAYTPDALFVALRCGEPNLNALRTSVTNRDGNVWEDDAVELLIGTADGGYRHIAVNAIGTLYDAAGADRAAFDGTEQAATTRETAAWTAEFAIPWTDLGGIPDGRTVSFEVVRYRTADRALLQFPPLNGGNHRVEMHGRLALAP
ncbi:MAG: metallophosphoesterase [Lentisphaerae bacterium]|nr:metallophosphoesterase [Lentisphaerota bacterium]